MRERILPLFALLALVALPADAAPSELARGAAAYQAGRMSAARGHAFAAVAADPKSIEAQTLLSRIHLALGDGVAAQAQIARARAAGLPVSRSRHLLAHALLLQNDPRRALAETGEGVAREDQAAAARIRGRAQIALGDFGAAGSEFERAIALAPGDSLAWSDTARFRMLAADVGGAIVAVDRALAANMRNVEALILKGELVRGQYGLVGSLPWFETALKVDPDNVAALTEYAATLGDVGRYREMLAATRRVLALRPNHAQAFYLQAVMAARARDFDLARSLLQRTGDSLSAVPAVLLLGGVLDLHAGGDEQAIVKLRRLLDIQPFNLEARKLLGAALLRSGDPRGTLDVLRPLAERGDAGSYALTLMGRAFEAIGERQAAAHFLDRAHMPAPADPSPFAEGDSMMLLARAADEAPRNAGTVIPFIRGLIARGETGPALARAQQLARENPGAPAAHVLVGDALVAQRRFGEAAGAFKRAANIRFSEPVALRLAETQERAGRRMDAARTLSLFLSQNPMNVGALRLAADWQLAAGDWDAAIDTLEGLRFRIGDRDAALLARLAWAYDGAGEGARALSYAAAGYALAPSNPAVTDTYGWVRFNAGDTAGALALLEKAVSIAPDHAGLQWHIAQVYAEAGQRDAAKGAARAALAQPDFAERAEAAALVRELG